MPTLTYRLTPEEYLTHLGNHEDINPLATRKEVWRANGDWIIDGAHGTASWDPEGFYWVRTNDLRVPNWRGNAETTDGTVRTNPEQRGDLH